MEMMGCWDLAVPGDVMRHVVQVESSFNPYAIGVVGGRLQRQPRTLAEATATARMLEEKGYNFSVGLAQVNRYNLAKYGLSTYERAFETCPNLQAGARILAECHQRAGGDWGKAFSCYYSGNFVTGFRHGYVQKVMASMGVSNAPDIQAIALAGARSGAQASSRPSRVESSTASLLARRMRAEAESPMAVSAMPEAAMPGSAPVAAPQMQPQAAPMAPMSMQQAGAAMAQVPPQAAEPAPVKVRLVGAPPVQAPAPMPMPAQQSASAAAAAAGNPAVVGSTVSNPSASRDAGRDEAFVF
ncbi:lytic transglycosylase domain-containing protein [Marilutibacter maris]